MSRFDDIVKFIEFDHKNCILIEPEKRLAKLEESLFDVLNTYNPGTIVKAGLGSGSILYKMADNFDLYIVVVEPSMKIIGEFINKHKGEKALERIKFINGDFNSFPVDYYAADLLICIDYLDFIESGRAVDEFRRALEFDAILFLGIVVLNDEDIDGLYDDFMRMAFPLHNDYYLVDDLKTFMDLNEFNFIKGRIDNYDNNVSSLVDYLGNFHEDSGKSPLKLIEEHSDDFGRLYKLRDDIISEPYYIGVFMRRKFVKTDSKI